MDVTVLHNAKAGDELYTPKKLTKLQRAAGTGLAIFPVKEAFGDKKIFKEALRGKQLVVVAGGDGSLRKVAIRLAGSKHTIAVFATWYCE